MGSEARLSLTFAERYLGQKVNGCLGCGLCDGVKCWSLLSFGCPWSGIPCELASLARVPFVSRKGREWPLGLLASSYVSRKGRFVRSIAASFGFARAITGYSFLIQNTASPMSPDHRSSGRLLVGEPFGVSQFLSVVVL